VDWGKFERWSIVFWCRACSRCAVAAWSVQALACSRDARSIGASRYEVHTLSSRLPVTVSLAAPPVLCQRLFDGVCGAVDLYVRLMYFSSLANLARDTLVCL